MILEILKDFMEAFTERCKNRTVDILAFLWSTSVKTENFIEEEKKINYLELDLTAQHMDNLIRNLSGFNLKLTRSKEMETVFSEQLPHRSIDT